MFNRGTAFLVMRINRSGKIMDIGVYSEPHPTAIAGETMFCLNAFPADPVMFPIPYDQASRQMVRWAKERLPSGLQKYLKIHSFQE